MPVTKSALRAMRNVTRGASDAQAAVRAATSNDALPPTGRQLHDIARASYDAADLPGILEVLDKRLNDKGKYWRHVYKSLIVLDYLLHTGAPSVAAYFRQNIYVIKTLGEFQHVDDAGRDVGRDVRLRARDVARLLRDPALLEDARKKRRAMYDRMAGRESKERRSVDDERPPALPPRPKAQQDREEEELKRVLKLSEQEEAARRAAVEKANSGDVFDNIPETLIDLDETPALVPQPTIMPQHTLASLQPQYTSYLQPQYTAAYLQPQYTTVQPQYTQALQPQYTAAYDPYGQQAQYEALLQQQQQQQQQWQQPKPVEAHLTVNIGSNNPFGTRPVSAPVYDPTTNPFAPSSASTPRSTTPSSAASLSPPPRTPPSAQHEYGYARSASSFAVHDDYAHFRASSTDFVRPYSAADAERVGKRQNAYTHGAFDMSALESALASREDGGLDTFGNVGALRYGPTTHGRIAAQRTGAY